jgi:hypothetical protein
VKSSPFTGSFARWLFGSPASQFVKETGSPLTTQIPALVTMLREAGLP